MIQIKTTLQFRGPATATKRDLRESARAELMAAGGVWHDKYLPLHFKESAYQRYGDVFAKRSAKYNRQKGHSRPMFQSGEMMRQVMAMATIRGTAKRVGVTVRGVRAVNFSKRPGMPDFKAEITAINATEANALARLMSAGVAKRLNAIKRVRTVHANAKS